ncbi:MAG: beta-galactosidase [Ferruginibacter sp.]
MNTVATPIDKTYLNTLKKLWQQNGITGPFYTADGATPFMLEAGSVEGAAIGLDPGVNDDNFETAAKFILMCRCLVPKLTQAGSPIGKKNGKGPDTADLKKEIEYLLKNGRSFNLYVVHGGTNFGFYCWC